MPVVYQFLQNFYALSLDAAPWLILGLLVAAAIKFFLPPNILKKYFAGSGILSIIRAAILGTPLPLCSCSVLPAAVTLRRSGASRGSTASFLIATPENGIDSLAVSYALLGPFLTIIRPIAAISTAIFAGLFIEYLTPKHKQSSANQPLDTKPNCCSSTPTPQTSCCTSSPQPQEQSSCCSSPQPTTTSTCCSTSQPTSANKQSRILTILRYAFSDLYRSIALWLIVGIITAAAVQTFIPPEKLTEAGSGFLPMLLAGISPGTALVFLLAGPATNIGSLAIIRREIGTSATFIYLASIAICSLAAGLFTDYLVNIFNINISAELAQSHSIIPAPLAIASLILLAFATLPLIPTFLRKLTSTKAKPSPPTSCCSN